MKILKFTSTAFLTVLFCIAIHACASIADAQRTIKQPPKCNGANGLTQDEIAQLVNVHNFVRAGLNLQPLVWDCKLADYAQEWATRGNPAHRDERDFGESIFVSGASDASAISAVNKWMLERPSWDNKTGACKPGKVCTHYTQIVWKKTKRIGCGINRNASGKWKTMLVCNYDPPGNIPGRPAY